MECSEARDKLELHALGALDAGDRKELKRHLQHCPSCRDRMAECDFMVDELRQEAGPDERERQWKEATAETLRKEIDVQAGRVSPFRRFAWGAAAAAAVVIAVVGWHLLSGRSGEQPGRQLASLPQHAENWTKSGLLSVPRSSATGYVVDGRRIYALRRRETGRFICAFDAESGQHVWQSRLPAIGYLSATGSQVLCLTASDGTSVGLAALNKDTGQVEWRFERSKPRRVHSLTRPLQADGGRICWTLGGTVHALDADTGSRIWSQDVSPSAQVSAPAVAGGSILVASGRNILCLGLEKGVERWRRELPQELQGQSRPLLSLSGNRAFLVQKNHLGRGKLCCMDLRSRTVDWTRKVNRPFDMLSRDGVVCLRGRRVVAYDAENGRSLWQRSPQGCGPLTASGQVVQYVDSSGTGSIVGVDMTTGRPDWRIGGVRSCDAFVRLKDTGYVKTREGTLRAISLRDPSHL